VTGLATDELEVELGCLASDAAGIETWHCHLHCGLCSTGDDFFFAEGSVPVRIEDKASPSSSFFLAPKSYFSAASSKVYPSAFIVLASSA